MDHGVDLRVRQPIQPSASITSNALFTRVAESIVIFGPIRQVGCASASSAVTDASSRRRRARGTARRWRSGPDARRPRCVPRPGTARWPSARCRPGAGGRAGRRRARRASAATRWPPVTSVSLLASATRSSAPGARPARRAGRPCRSWPRRPSRRRRRWRAPRVRRSPTARASPVGRSPVPRLSPAAKRRAAREAIVGVTRGEADHLEAVPKGGDDLERLAPDRPGRAQDGEARHTTRPATSSA